MVSKIRKITLERTPCYGSCPVYKVTVLGTGEVEYCGEANVARAGTHRWRISRRRLQRLQEAFERAKYLHLEDDYTECGVTGAPSCLTSVEYDDGGSKSIVHYHGDPSAPDALTELEDEIDRILGVERFTEAVFPPEGSRADAPAYLLTWNPDKAYKWEDLQDCIDDVRDHGFYATAWSCGRNRRITAGDRVFMMRQGHGSGERRGVFASGWATSDVYQQEHWDESEARQASPVRPHPSGRSARFRFRADTLTLRTEGGSPGGRTLGRADRRRCDPRRDSRRARKRVGAPAGL